LLELSAAQVDQVIDAAGAPNGVRGALAGVRDLTASAAQAVVRDHRGLSSSFLSGLLVLAAFPDDRTYMGNAQIARMLGMSLATSHRYISTLLAVGLLERDPETRKYRRT
jgi:Fic family protein